MDVEDAMLEVHQKVEWELSALDAELDQIDDADNIDQLELLIKEINIMERYRVVPVNEWYEERIKYIITYKGLDWDYMIHKFEGKNVFLHETSVRVVMAMDAVLQHWEASSDFSLEQYQYIIYNVHNVWTYYKKHYVSDTGYDMEDLLVDMTHL
jgi:hypothetical protein